MAGAAAEKTTSVPKSQAGPGFLDRMRRKIWLPKLVYDLLPWFYILASIAAFLATIYIESWFWVVPYSLLLSAACIHLAIFVFRSRHRAARESKERDNRF